MKVAFYSPFKPLDHPRPSGDQTTALGLTAHLRAKGHAVEVASRFRARHLAEKPWLWPQALWEAWRAGSPVAGAGRADVWLTHHAYYKSPDVIGPWASRRMGAPYAVFQGIYSTKRRKSLSTRLGFELNRRSLLAADVVFSNRSLDVENLRRLLPEDRIVYVAPGIDPDAFRRDPDAGAALRRELGEAQGEGRRPVIACVAMMRDDVKAQGLRYLITRLGRLARQERDFLLLLAGDGETRPEMEALAREHLPGRSAFVGQVPRGELARIYSAADLFVFPGIRESLGMVYLEAQAAGLPVVAFDNGGIPEVVAHGETGLLTPPFDDEAFLGAVARLLDDAALRRGMGAAAALRVRERHDARRNFDVVEERLRLLVEERRHPRYPGGRA
ncbi:glycosyltransferase family 4 protein [Fundidesulfovibrio soli]|uniref:glycosyltransferase family 4 protein n=1 Tax=Fundidesulfovibrio soli TaxID=2922716 RepID=UPI001FAEC92F|nr:glycosyltransferase family 4 protein [Fundidesulfovibrio soli]